MIRIWYALRRAVRKSVERRQESRVTIPVTQIDRMMEAVAGTLALVLWSVAFYFWAQTAPDGRVAARFSANGDILSSETRGVYLFCALFWTIVMASMAYAAYHPERARNGFKRNMNFRQYVCQALMYRSLNICLALSGIGMLVSMRQGNAAFVIIPITLMLLVMLAFTVVIFLARTRR